MHCEWLKLSIVTLLTASILVGFMLGKIRRAICGVLMQAVHVFFRRRQQTLESRPSKQIALDYLPSGQANPVDSSSDERKKECFCCSCNVRRSFDANGRWIPKRAVNHDHVSGNS